jgi:hypothetical protein
VPENADLGDWLRWVSISADPELLGLATAARAAYTATVARFKRDNELDTATGVAIYFPMQVGSGGPPAAAPHPPHAQGLRWRVGRGGLCQHDGQGGGRGRQAASWGGRGAKVPPGPAPWCGSPQRRASRRCSPARPALQAARGHQPGGGSGRGPARPAPPPLPQIKDFRSAYDTMDQLYVGVGPWYDFLQQIYMSTANLVSGSGAPRPPTPAPPSGLPRPLPRRLSNCAPSSLIHPLQPTPGLLPELTQPLQPAPHGSAGSYFMFEQPFAVPYLDYSYGSQPVYVIYGTLSTNLGLRAQMFYGFRAPDGALPGACCPGLPGAWLGASQPASEPASQPASQPASEPASQPASPWTRMPGCGQVLLPVARRWQGLSSASALTGCVCGLARVQAVTSSWRAPPRRCSTPGEQSRCLRPFLSMRRGGSSKPLPGLASSGPGPVRRPGLVLQRRRHGSLRAAANDPPPLRLCCSQAQGSWRGWLWALKQDLNKGDALTDHLALLYADETWTYAQGDPSQPQTISFQVRVWGWEGDCGCATAVIAVPVCGCREGCCQGGDRGGLQLRGARKGRCLSSAAAVALWPQAWPVQPRAQLGQG